MVKAIRKRKTKATTRDAGRWASSIAIVQVEDPFEPGKRVAVRKNISTTPLDAIAARGRLCGAGDSIEDGIARKLAGDKFQRLYERVEASDARAIDYSAVKVDVSFSARDITESRASATQEMLRIRHSLGVAGYDIVRSICGEQINFSDYVKSRAGYFGGQVGLGYYAALRQGLDDLIEHWGVARGRERSPMRSFAA